jgi:hypothetical protein
LKRRGWRRRLDWFKRSRVGHGISFDVKIHRGTKRAPRGDGTAPGWLVSIVGAHRT